MLHPMYICYWTLNKYYYYYAHKDLIFHQICYFWMIFIYVSPMELIRNDFKQICEIVRGITLCVIQNVGSQRQYVGSQDNLRK